MYCTISVLGITEVLYCMFLGVTQESAICGSWEMGLLVEQRENAQWPRKQQIERRTVIWELNFLVKLDPFECELILNLNDYSC